MAEPTRLDVPAALDHSISEPEGSLDFCHSQDSCQAWEESDLGPEGAPVGGSKVQWLLRKGTATFFRALQPAGRRALGRPHQDGVKTEDRCVGGRL